jgi:tropinone reductase I
MMSERWNLENRRALVVGGTRGIGRAVAEELMAFGAEVTIVARQQSDIDRFQYQATSQGFKLEGVKADVSTSAGLDTVKQWAQRRPAQLHILVNNVGTNLRKKTVDYDLAEFDRLMQTNFTSIWELSRFFHPYLKAAQGSSVVNIGSIAGQVAVGTGSIYGSLKAALSQLTKILSVEWAADQIRVNCVEPGFIRTDLTANLLANENLRKSVLNRTPLGRIGEPADVAALVVFLCLPAAAHITGQSIAIDGGFLASGVVGEIIAK